MTIQADTTESSNYSSTDDFHMREASVRMGNVFQSQRDAKFWAGRALTVSADHQISQATDPVRVDQPSSSRLASLIIAKDT